MLGVDGINPLISSLYGSTRWTLLSSREEITKFNKLLIKILLQVMEEKRLNYQLMNLVKNFNLRQILDSRVDRDWEEFDQLDRVEQLRIQLKELNQINRKV